MYLDQRKIIKRMLGQIVNPKVLTSCSFPSDNQLRSCSNSNKKNQPVKMKFSIKKSLKIFVTHGPIILSKTRDNCICVFLLRLFLIILFVLGSNVNVIVSVCVCEREREVEMWVCERGVLILYSYLSAHWKGNISEMENCGMNSDILKTALF